MHGGERSFLAALPGLRERFELHALAPPAGALADALRAAGLPVVGCDVKDAGDLRAGLAAVRPALVHGNSLSVGRTLGRLAGPAGNGLPHPATAHLRDILNLSAAATRDLGRCARLVAVSAATRAHHVARGLPADRVTVVHNGIDPAEWAVDRQATRVGVRGEFGLPDDAPVLLTVGQIGLRKGWDVLAGAAGRIHADPPPHHLCVGERWSRKPESVRFEAAVFERFEANAPGRAHRLGTRSDVPRLMAAADLLVHPARQEPFGRVLLEAAAAGLPVVAAAVGGTRELLGDAFADIPAGDAAALAAAVGRLLADRGERDALAVAARRRVGRFTVEGAADGLAAAWAAALGGA